MASNSSNPKIEIEPIKKFYYKSVPFQFRYGKTFRKYFNFLMKSSDWSTQKILDYQNEQFLKLINHCFTNVPYYKEKFAEYGVKKSSISSIDDIEKLPILTKQDIVQNLNKLQADNLKHLKKYKFSTSGSTGEKLIFYGLDDVYKIEAAFILRYFKLSGATMYDKPSIWLRRYVPKNSNSPLWYFDFELNRLYMSAYHLNENTIERYIKKINSINATTLVTYPSSAYVLSLLAKDKGLELKNIKEIRVASEKMQNSWVEQVSESFNITPLAHYGQIEKVCFMHQNSNLIYELNHEYGVTEFKKNEHGLNKIIGTGFLNYLMPFIRYETNDYADITQNKEKFIVNDILGRSSDILVSKDGALLPGVNFYSWIDKNLDGVAMYQIIQKRNKDVEFYYVPKFEPISEDLIIKGLQQRLGLLPIKVIVKEQILRDNTTGKIKLIQNEIKL